MNKIDEKMDKYLTEETSREKSARKKFLKDWGIVNKYVNNINKYVIKKGSWGFLEGHFESLKHLINYSMSKYIEDFRNFRNLNEDTNESDDLVEHTIEDQNGEKIYVKLPKDAKDIKFIENIFGGKNRVSFKTKFGGKKFTLTY